MKTALFLAATLATAAAFGVAAANPNGMPSQATYGLCKAWGANGGHDNPGNAPNAPPFQWLQDEAEAQDQTVEEYCALVPHPSENGNGNGPGNGNGNGA